MIMKKTLLIVAMLFMVAAPNRTTSQDRQKSSQFDSIRVAYYMNKHRHKVDTIKHIEPSLFVGLANFMGEKITRNGANPKY